MCVVSNVFIDQHDRWKPFTTPIPAYPWIEPTPDRNKRPTAEEIEDFIRRLEEAKAEDVRDGNEDCGTADKKERLLEVIYSLEIQFADIRSALDELKRVIEEL